MAIGLLAVAALVIGAAAVGSAREVDGSPVRPTANTAPPVTTGTEFSTRPIRPYPDITSGVPPTGPNTRPVRPIPSTAGGTTNPAPTVPSTTPTTAQPATPTSAPANPADDAGGLSGARALMTDFVAALNDNDPDRANTFLCSTSAGFGSHMLDGIVAGSLGVGGVSVTGSTGTAYITFKTAADGSEGRSEFALVVEDARWRVCDAK